MIKDDWSNAPTVSDLKEDYNNARPMADENSNKVKRWLDHLNITGSAKVNKRSGRSSITPKLIRKQAEWRYSSLSESLLSTPDMYDIDPVTYEDKKGAVQNAMMLNYQFTHKINKIKFIDTLIRTLVNEGTALARVGWEYTTSMETRTRPIYKYEVTVDPNIAQAYEQIESDLQNNPAALDQARPDIKAGFEKSKQEGVPVIAIDTGEEEEYTEEVTTHNEPTLDLVDHNNRVIDPTCKGDLNKAKFIITSYETSLAELKAHGKFTDLDKLEDSSQGDILAEPDHVVTDDNENFDYSDRARKRLIAREYWGLWDVEGDDVLVPIVATWVGDTLIQLEESPYPHKKLPFALFTYLPVKDSVYGEPDGELLIENQKILGAVTRGMIDSMGRSANGQIGMAKEALDTINKRRFNRGEDYEYNPNIDPSRGFYMHKYPEIPQSAQMMVALQNQEAEALTGVKSFSEGINSGSLGNVATSVKGALDAAGKRELGILRRITDGLRDIGEMIISMNGEFLEEEEVIRVTNEEFVTIRRDDLRGNFDLRLSISTIEADNAKAQELAFMLQTMGSTLDIGMSQIILADIAKLRKMPVLAKKLETYEPQPDPLEEERKKLEIELLKAQIANESAKANENNANALLDQAKARELGSKADKHDLDFVEQSEGVSHERQKELQSQKDTNSLKLKQMDIVSRQNDTLAERQANGN